MSSILQLASREDMGGHATRLKMIEDGCVSV